ncbi:MAG TPA: YqcC family protein [Spongiibacteraceae bacterium]|nr:YqcC family protein [Spongiibacteraceae bacterium]
MSVHIRIASLLIDIEAELRRLQQWQDEMPPLEALASVEPFCVDTLTFAQWLQFIFLPRMHALAAAQQLPPGRCEIRPIAEEFFGATPFLTKRLDVANLLRAIGELDETINAAMSR